MKVSKLEGLKILKILNFPTIETIDYNSLCENSPILKQGLSVRTSPKKDLENNVYLPSIHNCKDFKNLKGFVEKYKDDYYIIIHKTVKPEKIGSVSKYGNGSSEGKLAVEFFADFEKRKNEIIENTITVPVVGERFIISGMQMENKNKEDFNVFGKVLGQVKNLPFKKYDMEFVIEDENIIFTDLTIKGQKNKKYEEALKFVESKKPIKCEIEL